MVVILLKVKKSADYSRFAAVTAAGAIGGIWHKLAKVDAACNGDLPVTQSSVVVLQIVQT